MKVEKILLACLIFVVAISLHAQKTLPSVELKTLDGKTVNIQEYIGRGKPVLLAFWATWCVPCRKELDAMAEYYDDWKKDFNLEILAITIDDQRALAKVKPFVSSKSWEYTVLSDANQALKNALNFAAIPQTFLVGSKGEIVYSHSGYTPGTEVELEEKMKAIKQSTGL